jgi:hypothetical protein
VRAGRALPAHRCQCRRAHGPVCGPFSRAGKVEFAGAPRLRGAGAIAAAIMAALAAGRSRVVTRHSAQNDILAIVISQGRDR